MSLLLLPFELKLHILDYLNERSLLSLARTCKGFRTLATDNRYWREGYDEYILMKRLRKKQLYILSYSNSRESTYDIICISYNLDMIIHRCASKIIKNKHFLFRTKFFDRFVNNIQDEIPYDTIKDFISYRIYTSLESVNASIELKDRLRLRLESYIKKKMVKNGCFHIDDDDYDNSDYVDEYGIDPFYVE